MLAGYSAEMPLTPRSQFIAAIANITYLRDWAYCFIKITGYYATANTRCHIRYSQPLYRLPLRWLRWH